MTLHLRITFDTPLEIVSKADSATAQFLAEILHNTVTLMSQISDFAAKVQAFQDAQDIAIDGLTADVKSLNDKIAALQTSAGQITPEDQALLDAVQAHGQAIADKLSALDAQTPPVAPAA